MIKKIKNLLIDIGIIKCTFRRGSCSKHWEKVEEEDPFGEPFCYYCKKCKELVL